MTASGTNRKSGLHQEPPCVLTQHSQHGPTSLSTPPSRQQAPQQPLDDCQGMSASAAGPVDCQATHAMPTGAAFTAPAAPRDDGGPCGHGDHAARPLKRARTEETLSSTTPHLMHKQPVQPASGISVLKPEVSMAHQSTSWRVRPADLALMPQGCGLATLPPLNPLPPAEQPRFEDRHSAQPVDHATSPAGHHAQTPPPSTHPQAWAMQMRTGQGPRHHISRALDDSGEPPPQAGSPEAQLPHVPSAWHQTHEQQHTHGEQLGGAALLPSPGPSLVPPPSTPSRSQPHPSQPSPRLHNAAAGPYALLLVIDLEATCNETRDWAPVEIIELACVAVRARDLQVVGALTALPVCMVSTGHAAAAIAS